MNKSNLMGKFAPLLHELGEDERFILKSTDLDKLLYILIVFTCHMTHHQAPTDPRFYKIRYGLRSKGGQIVASLRRIADMYPKLSWANGKLSMLNSRTYKGRDCLEVEVEEEVYVDNKKTVKKFVKPTLEELKSYFSEKLSPACGAPLSEADKFFNFYESKGWVVGKSPMKNWKSAVANWIGNIKERTVKDPAQNPNKKFLDAKKAFDEQFNQVF